MSHDDELDAMKRYPLTEVLARLGFVENKRKSSRHSSFMVHPDTNLKFVVSLNTNGHWRFFPVGSQSRGGTVIDALKVVCGYSIGQCRQHMRPLLSGTVSTASLPDPQTYSLQLVPVKADVAELRRQFHQSVSPIKNGRHVYLNDHRGLPPALLAMPAFRSVMTDRHHNAVFPHRDRHGEIVGAELRNVAFRGQIKSGIKTLWYSLRPRQEEKRTGLVIAESGIDACSYAAQFYCAKTCYISTGGTLSPLQKELISAAINKLPHGCEGTVTAATDHDQAGDALAAQIKTLFDASERGDLRFRIHHPDKGGWDWNDQWLHRLNTSPAPSLDLA